MTISTIDAKNAELFLSITPMDKNKISKLIESFVVFQERIRSEGIISEVIPAVGINLYIPFDSSNLLVLPEATVRTILTSLGVRMLKLAKIEGSTEIKNINIAKKGIDSYSYIGFVLTSKVLICRATDAPYSN